MMYSAPAEWADKKPLTVYHKVNNYIEDKATPIVFGWKFHEFWPEWRLSSETLLLGDKDMEWLEKSSLNALLVSWIHIDVDFKSGLCYTARKSGMSMIQTA